LATISTATNNAKTLSWKMPICSTKLEVWAIMCKWTTYCTQWHQALCFIYRFLCHAVSSSDIIMFFQAE